MSLRDVGIYLPTYFGGKRWGREAERWSRRFFGLFFIFFFFFFFHFMNGGRGGCLQTRRNETKRSYESMEMDVLFFFNYLST